MKRTKFYAGISALGASIVFTVQFFVLLGRKKSLAQAFAALAAVTSISGAVLLILDAKEKTDFCCDEDDSLECSDFDYDSLDDGSIDCTFEESQGNE